MIKGRYVKGNNVTEIMVGNGMTEIVPAQRELQVFTFEKKRRRPHKRIEELTLANTLMLGIALGCTFGCILVLALTGTALMSTLALMTIALDAIMVVENLWRDKE